MYSQRRFIKELARFFNVDREEIAPHGIPVYGLDHLTSADLVSIFKRGRIEGGVIRHYHLA